MANKNAKGRPTKLTAKAQEDIVVGDEAVMLSVIYQAAASGDRDAAAWLRGEGYIHVTDEPHRAVFVRFTNQDGRHSSEARAWARAVLTRDGFRCRHCGRNGELQAHHIKTWGQYPELRFDLANGLTLCVACHAAAHPQYPIISCRKLKRRQASGK